MKTEAEILDRIESIKRCNQMESNQGFIPISDVRKILINNLKWVIGKKVND